MKKFVVKSIPFFSPVITVIQRFSIYFKFLTFFRFNFSFQRKLYHSWELTTSAEFCGLVLRGFRSLTVANQFASLYYSGQWESFVALLSGLSLVQKGDYKVQIYFRDWEKKIRKINFSQMLLTPKFNHPDSTSLPHRCTITS